MNGAVQLATDRRSTVTAALSITAVVSETYRLVWDRRGQLVRAIALPAVSAVIILSAALQCYYTLLGVFLVAPSPRRAGVLFAVLIAGALAWLFAAVLLASAGAAVAEDDYEPAGWREVAFGFAQARLFCAALRLTIVLFFIACLSAGLIALANALFQPPWIPTLVLAAAGAAAVVILVRASFLLPALARRERRAVLRRSLKLSRGNFWRLAAVYVVIAGAPAAALYGLGEFVLGGWLTPDDITSFGSAARTASELSKDYASIPAAILLTVITTICLTLAGIGSDVAYRQLVEQRY